MINYPTTLFASQGLPQPKYNFAGEISFGSNWNKKLGCQYFTTIRLQNLAKYHIGNVFKIIKKGDYLLDAKIVQLRYCKLHDLPELTCYLDTGYSKEATIALFKKMYQSKNIDWEKQLLSIILLEHLDWDKP